MNVKFYTTNAYQNYPQLQQDVNDVKGQVARVDSVDKQVGSSFAPCVEKSCFGSLPPVRRVMSLNDKVSQGDVIGVAGLMSLALVNLPEDCRDIGAAYKQGAAYLQGKPYQAAYDATKFQHDFSFFRGTLLHHLVDPNTTKNPKLTEKLLSLDVPLSTTNWGEKLINFFGAKESKVIDTTIEDIGHTVEAPRWVLAKEFKGSMFGQLTGRAMTRIPKIGAIALALLELPQILKSMNKGDTISEQASSTVNQTAKSAVNVTSILAGIGYGGAIGAKMCGNRFSAIGSLVGMGVGAVFGALTSKKIQEFM